MGRENYYKPGSFYRICERTGFCERAERTRMEWNGLIVRDRSWERRQPQDFVKGVRDDQTVPRALPRTPPVFDGPLQSTLAVSAMIRARIISVNSPFTFNIGDRLAITLDADLGIVFFCRVSDGSDLNRDFNNDYWSSNPTGPDYNDDFSPNFAITAGTNNPSRIIVTPALPGSAASGNLVANLSVGGVSASSYGASNGG